MNKKATKFLEFNGKTLMFLSVDGQYWIALKPICEALGVNWKYQHGKLLKDKILSQLSRNIGMVAQDKKVRKMTSLPENSIYGWIFKLESVAEGMEEYQWECYNALYNHFHGTITGRKELLKQKAMAQVEIGEVMNTLTTDNALKIDKAKRKLNQVTAQLRALDGETLEEERNLFTS